MRRSTVDRSRSATIVRFASSSPPSRCSASLGVTGALDQLPSELVESQLRLVRVTRLSVGHHWTIPAAPGLPIT